jgi:diguanylate cyclase (GGDEF)-like protein/PAS domain S-box-containing protein
VAEEAIPSLGEPAASGKRLASQDAIAQDSAVAVIITDAIGVIEWVNPSFTALTGYTPAEAKGRRPGELLQGPNTDPAVVMQMRDALVRQSGFDVEVLNYHKNGSSYWRQLTIDPVFDDGGKLLHFVGVATNIGERKHNEQSLRLAISQLTATLESTTDGILVVDLDQKITRVNQRFMEMWSIPQQIIDSGDDDRVVQFVVDQLESPVAFVAKIEALYAAPEQESFDVLQFKDGRTFERYSRPQYVGGHAIGRVWSFRDITERTQAERMQAALYRISEAAHSAQDLSALFPRIHEIVGELLPASNFFVALYDESIDELSFPYFIDEFDTAPAPRTLDSGTLAGEVIRSGLALLVTPDTQNDLPPEARTIVGSESIDWLGVPLVSHPRAIGALVVQSYSGLVRYTERDKDLLEFVSAQVAAAIERKLAENALRESEERHRLLADNAADVIWTLDKEGGRRTYISPSVTKLRGYTVAELMQQPLFDAFTPDSAQDFKRYVDSVAAGIADPSYRVELQQPCKDGSTVWVEATVTSMTTANGEIVGFLGVSRDISERKQQATRIEYLAFYDALTRLPNRALFQDRLGHALGTAERRGQSVALLFMDLDRFKEINDSLGHAIGDQVLIEVARRLQANARQEETLARLGGDEFVLVAEGADQEAAAMIAERMLEALVEPIVVTGNIVSVRGSIGLALYPEDGETPDDLIRHTDIAMYRAKANGGGFRFYQPDMGIDLEKRLRMTARLSAAMDAGRLELFYQPHLSLETGRLRGAEALLRWHDGEFGWVSPAEFISIAEERGMMGPLGDWVLATACRQLKAWRESGLDFPGRLAVNVSARQLHDPEIADRLQAIVRDAGLTPNMFELELTESSMMADPEGAVAIMETLSNAGFSLAIDDFGTGYSSLSYLKRFSVDRIKIDISFVRDMLSNNDDYAIVKAIIAMADSLGLETTAEGVELVEQAKALSELGCDFVQGYHFGRPQPAHMFEERWLRTMLTGSDISAR